MLTTILVLLIVLWLLGMVSSYTLGGFIHLLLVLAIAMRDRARTIALRGSALLFAYILVCAAMHARALAVWRRLDPAPVSGRMAVLPQFLSPFRWLGLSEHEGEIRYAFFDVGPFATGGGEPRTPQKWSEVLPSLWEGYPPPSRAKTEISEPPKASPIRASIAVSWLLSASSVRMP